MAKKNVKYIPIQSSYIVTEILGAIAGGKAAGIIPSNIANNFNGFLDVRNPNTYVDSFEVIMRQCSAGEIFNLYQKMILNSQWDCRDNGDYQTLVLGREHMFYTVDDKTISINDDYYEKNFVKKISFNIEKQNIIDFFPYVNDKLISSGDASLYDEGQILASDSNKLNFKNDVNLEKMMYRYKCRKVSENFFAISGFNLISHSISIKSDVPNTVSERYKDDNQANIISIIGDLDTSYINEVSFTPEFPASSVEADKDNEHRSDEFLANKLLEELRYCYQGSIIIKYNPNIEIGDTITLMDNVSSTYGIFQVDSYEHSLDQRGLLTSLTVKASWNPKDPLLDYHSTEIGYKLVNYIKKQFKLGEDDGSRETQINKLMTLYFKYLVQSPKYCVFYKKKKPGFFDRSTIKDGNFASPSALPLRFYPMYIKGKIQMPKSLEYAFVQGKENSFIDLTDRIAAKCADLLNSFTSGFVSAAKTILLFSLDLLISTVTFNIHELFKPLFGRSMEKALESAFDKVEEFDDNLLDEMLNYNPYSNKYKLMYGNNYKFKIGFFNIRLQKEDDLYANNTTLARNKNNNTKFIDRKIEVVTKMLRDVFDTMLLVELYDGFKVQTTDKNQYSVNDFLEDCANIYNKNDVILKETIYEKKSDDENSDKYNNKEYGAILNNQKNSLVSVKKTSKIDLENDRSAVEIIYDISNLNIDGKNKIKNLIVVFFHNLYGSFDQIRDESIISERIANVEKLLERYEKYYNSEDTGVAIMADFNLTIYNQDKNPMDYGDSADNNNKYRLPNDKFIAKIISPTTYNSKRELKNQYDNVLVSKNINDFVVAKVFQYPEKDALTISDHIPVYLAIGK